MKKQAIILTKKNKPILALATILLLLILVPVVVTNLQKQRNLQNQAAASSVSSLIFGTNLTLTDANDQFLTSAQTRTILSQIHVQLIRMPIRSFAPASPSPWETTTMQDIKAMGAIPLIVLKFHQTDPVGAAIAVVKQAASIFGTSQVYFELGNEVDLAFGVTSQQYTAEWNQVIPQLALIDPNAKFIGPVNFQSNPKYEADFYHTAVPKPDAISWHEYTCGNGQDAQTVCIGHIANWKNHITAFKAAIQSNGDQIPPVFITEWNYDPNNPNPDSRATAQFQQQFTQTALQELANDGVAGAAHYVATGHQYYNLVDPGDILTPEGQMFGQMWNTLGMGNNLPTINPSINPTISLAPSIITGPPSLSPSPGVWITPTLSPIPSGGISPTQPVRNVICSSNTLKACSYTSNCGSYLEGSLCEFQVNGCGTASSGSNIYICQNKKWVYRNWVKNGQCNFCEMPKSTTQNSSSSNEHE